METALLLCSYVYYSVVNLPSDETGFLNVELPNFPFYPHCRACDPKLNVTFIIGSGTETETVEVAFGSLLVNQNKSIYTPVHVTGGKDGADRLFVMELLGGGLMAITIDVNQSPVSGSEGNKPVTAFLVRFTDFMDVTRCHLVNITDPIVLYPNLIPPSIAYENDCNASSSTAQVTGQTMDWTVNITMDAEPEESSFQIRLELGGNGMHETCDLENYLSPIAPGSNTFFITCSGDKPNFASGGILTPISPMKSATEYNYSLWMGPRPVPAILGTSAKAFLWYHYTGNVLDGKTRCIMTDLNFTGYLHTPQQTTVSRQSLSFTRGPVVFELTNADSNTENTAANVTICAYWGDGSVNQSPAYCVWVFATHGQNDEVTPRGRECKSLNVSLGFDNYAQSVEVTVANPVADAKLVIHRTDDTTKSVIFVYTLVHVEPHKTTAVPTTPSLPPTSGEVTGSTLSEDGHPTSRTSSAEISKITTQKTSDIIIGVTTTVPSSPTSTQEVQVTEEEPVNNTNASSVLVGTGAQPTRQQPGIPSHSTPRSSDKITTVPLQGEESQSVPSNAPYGTSITTLGPGPGASTISHVTASRYPGHFTEGMPNPRSTSSSGPHKETSASTLMAPGSPHTNEGAFRPTKGTEWHTPVTQHLDHGVKTVLLLQWSALSVFALLLVIVLVDCTVRLPSRYLHKYTYVTNTNYDSDTEV
ncbi:ORF45 [callitrichine gammaherpesvirus 3]|uniref:ORF45 n=1 Tax=callitrichine gammaherpesvirus 3 TaxID=106331 RepID=Q993G4_9GAMA|nr:ORF45 [callitrichine gammaherpesvirus 3]AAK38254.1 ORF45 [callitrichine gammaherpesvirus 3]